VRVPYGAVQMPAVVRVLQDRLGVLAKRADWLTVFEL
jgi:hypothetical protein